MKKTLSMIVLIIVLSLSLTAFFGCNGNGDDSSHSGTVTVNFVVDGDVYSKAWTNSEGKVSFPDDPEKEDHTFEGWYLDENFSSEFKESTVLNPEDAKTVNVYAKFEAIVNHSLMRYPAIAAGCLTNGSIEYYKCKTCGKLFSDSNGKTEITAEDTVVKASGHTFKTEWSYNNYAHWHDASCGHSVKSDSTQHTVNGGLCEVCGNDSIYVTYEMFGAKGDGVNDDFLEMMQAHEYANQNKLPVVADSSKTYYIGTESIGKSIEITTDTNFGSATIKIDDDVINPFKNDERAKDVFYIKNDPDNDTYSWEKTDFLNMGLVEGTTYTEAGGGQYTVYKRQNGKPVFTKGQTNIGITFDKNVMLLIQNYEEKVYIRYGGNANDGNPKCEVILVDKNGNVDPSTPILWDYGALSSVEVIPVDQTSITVSGGTIVTLAISPKTPNAAEIAEGYLPGDQYYYIYRGILVARSNTTLYGIRHEKVNENIRSTDGTDAEKMSGGYPYRGWYNASYCNNVLFDSCYMVGHRVYIEDRDTDGDGVPNVDKGTWMGTYDINAYMGNNVTWKNCQQINEIANTDLWGIMGSNFVKNLTYDGCTLSRFDAHQGVYNATVKDSVIGRDITVVGSGTLTVEGTTKYLGTAFITLRTDYGATWEGPVIVKNCTHHAYKSYDASKNTGTPNGSGAVFAFEHTANHNFGYTCYLFTEITVDNIEFTNTTSNYLLYATGTFTTSSFTDSKNPYQMPTRITVRNQTDTMKLCNKTGTIKTKYDSGKLTIVDSAGKLTIV